MAGGDTRPSRVTVGDHTEAIIRTETSPTGEKFAITTSGAKVSYPTSQVQFTGSRYTTTETGIAQAAAEGRVSLNQIRFKSSAQRREFIATVEALRQSKTQIVVDEPTGQAGILDTQTGLVSVGKDQVLATRSGAPKVVTPQVLEAGRQETVTKRESDIVKGIRESDTPRVERPAEGSAVLKSYFQEVQPHTSSAVFEETIDSPFQRLAFKRQKELDIASGQERYLAHYHVREYKELQKKILDGVSTNVLTTSRFGRQVPEAISGRVGDRSGIEKLTKQVEYPFGQEAQKISVSELEARAIPKPTVPPSLKRLIESPIRITFGGGHELATVPSIKSGFIAGGELFGKAEKVAERLYTSPFNVTFGGTEIFRTPSIKESAAYVKERQLYGVERTGQFFTDTSKIMAKRNADIIRYGSPLLKRAYQTSTPLIEKGIDIGTTIYSKGAKAATRLYSTGVDVTFGGQPFFSVPSLKTGVETTAKNVTGFAAERYSSFDTRLKTISSKMFPKSADPVIDYLGGVVFQGDSATAKFARRNVPEYLKGFSAGIREEPTKAALTAGAFFILPGALKGGGFLAKKLIGAKATSTFGKFIGVGLGTTYAGSVGLQTALSDRPARFLGRLTSSELLPMAAGGYAGAKFWRQFGKIGKDSGRVDIDVRTKTHIPTKTTFSVTKPHFKTRSSYQFRVLKNIEVSRFKGRASPEQFIFMQQGKGKIVYRPGSVTLPKEYAGQYHSIPGFGIPTIKVRPRLGERLTSETIAHELIHSKQPLFVLKRKYLAEPLASFGEKPLSYFGFKTKTQPPTHIGYGTIQVGDPSHVTTKHLRWMVSDKAQPSKGFDKPISLRGTGKFRGRLGVAEQVFDLGYSRLGSGARVAFTGKKYTIRARTLESGNLLAKYYTTKGKFLYEGLIKPIPSKGKLRLHKIKTGRRFIDTEIPLIKTAPGGEVYKQALLADKKLLLSLTGHSKKFVKGRSILEGVEGIAKLRLVQRDAGTKQVTTIKEIGLPVKKYKAYPNLEYVVQEQHKPNVATVLRDFYTRQGQIVLQKHKAPPTVYRKRIQMMDIETRYLYHRGRIEPKRYFTESIQNIYQKGQAKVIAFTDNVILNIVGKRAIFSPIFISQAHYPPITVTRGVKSVQIKRPQFGKHKPIEARPAISPEEMIKIVGGLPKAKYKTVGGLFKPTLPLTQVRPQYETRPKYETKSDIYARSNIYSNVFSKIRSNIITRPESKIYSRTEPKIETRERIRSEIRSETRTEVITEIPIVPPGGITGVGRAGRVPTPPRSPPPIPKLGFDFIPKKKKKPKGVREIQFRYQPSLVAVAKKLRGKKPTLLTGLRVRLL